MTANQPRSIASQFARKAVAPLAALFLVFGVAACAPEEVAGSVDKESETTSPETKWEVDDTAGSERNATLPDSFPSELFALPADATIYNAGERNSDEWFLVLNAVDATAAQSLWASIIELNGFAVSDELETTEGGTAATLAQGPLMIQAMTLPNEDGSVLLSYDVTRML